MDRTAEQSSPSAKDTTGRQFPWMVGLIVLALVTAILLRFLVSNRSMDLAVSATQPVKVEHVQGTEPTRVTLSEEAAKRLDIQVVPAGKMLVGQAHVAVVPYAALVYDPQGNTWTYLQHGPFAFVR